MHITTLILMFQFLTNIQQDGLSRFNEICSCSSRISLGSLFHDTAPRYEELFLGM